MSAVAISKELNIASSTASESAVRGHRIVEEQGLKLLNEDIQQSENPKNVPYPVDLPEKLRQRIRSAGCRQEQRQLFDLAFG